MYNFKLKRCVKHEYYIVLDKKRVGYVRYAIRNKILYISTIEIYERFQKQGIAKDFISFLFNKYKINFIIGETLKSSRVFWKKMIKTYNGIRKNIAYYDDCTSSFILNKNFDNKHKFLFKNRYDMYKTLEKFSSIC